MKMDHLMHCGIVVVDVHGEQSFVKQSIISSSFFSGCFSFKFCRLFWFCLYVELETVQLRLRNED